MSFILTPRVKGPPSLYLPLGLSYVTKQSLLLLKYLLITGESAEASQPQKTEEGLGQGFQEWLKDLRRRHERHVGLE